MECHDAVSDDGNLFLDPAADLTPVPPSHAGQTRGLATGVSRHSCELIGRHIQPVLTRVLDEEIVSLDTGYLPVDQASESADAVVMMHHKVPWVEVAVGIARLAPCPTASRPV